MRKIVEMKRGAETWHIQVDADTDEEAKAVAVEHAYPTAQGMPEDTNGPGWKARNVLERFPWEDDVDAAWAIEAGADFSGSPLLDHPLVREHLERQGIDPEKLR